MDKIRYWKVEAGKGVQLVYHPEIITEEHILAITADHKRVCISPKYDEQGQDSNYPYCNNIDDCRGCLFHENTFKGTDDFITYLLEHKLATKEIILQLNLKGAFN